MLLDGNLLAAPGRAAVASPALAESEIEYVDPILSRVCSPDYDIWHHGGDAQDRQPSDDEAPKQCDTNRNVGQEWAVSVNWKGRCWILHLTPFGPNAVFSEISSEREKPTPKDTKEWRRYKQHTIAITGYGPPWRHRFHRNVHATVRRSSE